MIANLANKSAAAPAFRVGDERLVKLTPSAAQKVSTLLTKQGRPNGVLRVAVLGGGCSGLQYKMDLQDAPASRDHRLVAQLPDGPVSTPSRARVPTSVRRGRRGGMPRPMSGPSR